MKHRHLIVLVAIVMIALAPATQAHANMAPPQPPTAGALGVGEPSTYVQMVSEDVLMTIGDDRADVKATFNMLNQGAETETLNVRFPVGIHYVDRDGDEVEDWSVDVDSFTVHVDGSRKGSTVTKSDSSLDLTIWATWQVIFPPGQRVQVEVKYRTLRAYSDSFSDYSYILSTGAGWYNAIGEGTVTIRLPYEINKDNVLSDWMPESSIEYTITGTDISWHFTDLEPTNHNDIYVTVMVPPAWRAWQAAEKAVEKNPDSVSAHLQLAHALGNVSYVGEGCSDYGCERYDRALEEYKTWLNVIPDESVLQVIPNIVDYHLAYLDLLWVPWNVNDGGLFCPELLRVSKLAPRNEDVLELRERYDWCTEEYLTPIATSTVTPSPTQTSRPTRTPRPTWTPSPTPTITFTPTPRPTLTTTPMLTATSMPTPTSQPKSIRGLQIGILVGIAAVVIAGAGIGVWAARRKARSAGD